MLSKKYKYHFKNNIKLAYPVTLSQLGHMLTALADTLMVGSLGAIPLAAVAFGHTIFSMFLEIPFASLPRTQHQYVIEPFILEKVKSDGKNKQYNIIQYSHNHLNKQLTAN